MCITINPLAPPSCPDWTSRDGSSNTNPLVLLFRLGDSVMPYPCPLLLPLLLMVSGGVLLPRGVMGMEVGVGPPGRYGTPGLSGLTVLIPPGQDSCVYFPVQPGDQWIFYYQVSQRLPGVLRVKTSAKC